MSGPRLSVVLPTYQRAALLHECLCALAASNCTDFEVVAVDDGSTDDTGAVLRGHADKLPLTALTQASNAGPAAARNRGIQAASGNLILFIDDDVVVSPDLLAEHLRLHEQAADPLVCFLGRVEWHPELTVTPFMQWLDRSGLQFAYDTWLREGPVDPPYAAFYTANLSMRRELLVAVGGFDERFPYPAYEDMELAYRLVQLGLRMEYRPGALAWHGRSIDLAVYRRRMSMVARSAALLEHAAPTFPLDDTALIGRECGRLRRGRLAVRAALLRDESSRSDHYWAQIASSYAAAARATRKQAS